MKLTILLLTIGFLQVHATGFGQRVTLKVTNASLPEIVSKLRSQTDVDFLYNNNTISDFKPVSLSIVNQDLLKILDACFKDQPFVYKQNRNTILITRKPEAQPATVVEALVVFHVTGTVVDSATNEALSGVSVAVQGSGAGTKTNNSGQYSLDVPGPTSVLLFTSIGYKPVTVQVNDRATISIMMAKAETKLADVVVVGYGTRTKGAVTGAISTVSAQAFESRPLNNTFDALQGAAPGVTITRNSGQPGSQGYNLQVRGYSSINGNAPLVLIDGVPGELGPLNPSDIQEISILKDAAAAIYGARAADGVIIVTTKKGRRNSGTPRVNYTMNYGVKQPNYLKKMMNTLQYAEFQNEGLTNVGIQGFPQSVFDNIRNNAAPDLTQGWNYGLSGYPSFYGYTDWNDVIFKNASQQLHNVSISGGGENNNYLISLGYNKDDGTLAFGQNNSARYNLRLNYDFRLGKRLSFQTRTFLENTLTKTPTMLGNALPNVVRQFPYQPVYNQLGQFYGYQGYENPAQSLSEGGLTKGYFNRIETNFKADYNIIDGLTLTGQAAVRLDYANSQAITPTFTRYNYVGDVQDIRNTPNQANYTNGRVFYRLYQVYADYSRQFGQDHKTSLTAGTSLEQTDLSGQSITGYNFPGNRVFTLNLADRTDVAYSNFSGNLSSQALNSYFGRFSYSFRNKLIADVTARIDGSSKFSTDKRWSAIFPSAAIAYNLSEEGFIRKADIFDQLKVRASWGRMGNQEIGSLGLFDYVPLIAIGGVYPLGSPNAGVPGALANPASATRTWETIENKNIGVDMQFLKSRLSFTFDYYNKTNRDMLVGIAVPATFGGSAPSSNQGKLVTKGFEGIVTWKDQIGKVRYSIALQLSDNKNKLVELKNTDNFSEGLNQFRKDYPINSYFGYVYEGIIQTQAQLDAYKQLEGIPNRIAIGDVMYRDVDGDGKLTAFGDKTKGLAGDMMYLGNLSPRYIYSSNISAGFKNFDLSIFLQGVGKRDIQYQGNIATPNTFFWPTLAYYYGKTWSPDRTDAKYPRNIVGSVGFDDLRNYDYRTSSLTMQNAAYLRFKVITLSYSLPANLATRMKMTSARIYISGQDLFTVSKGTLGKNFDPEDGFRNESTYPLNKVYSIGLDVTF